jgi:hypothetical protein
MRLNRPLRALTVTALVAVLFGAPAAFAADSLTQSPTDTVVLLNPGSWLTQALDVLSGWLTEPVSTFTCPDGTTDCTDTTGGPVSPDGGGMPSPDNGPGLDPNG